MPIVDPPFKRHTGSDPPRGPLYMRVREQARSHEADEPLASMEARLRALESDVAKLKAANSGIPSPDDRRVREVIMRALFAQIKEKGGVNPEDFAHENHFSLSLVYEVLEVFQKRGWVE